MIKCTKLGIEPSPMCYEICVLASRCDALKAWEREKSKQMWALPSIEPKTDRDCTDFVRWLMDEVMDEENWQMNAVANGEIICRKLKKLGLLEVKDGYYIRPSAEARPTGEWIFNTSTSNGKSWNVCSECGDSIFHPTNFCPNCGADMRGMAIEALSAEPKTGKWVKVIDEETPNVTKWHYECDQCRAGRWEKGQRYCSRCGAKMLGEDGEEE